MTSPQQTSTDLVTFLRDRLDEDEAEANKAHQRDRWRISQEHSTLKIETDVESMGWEFGGATGVWTCDDSDDDCWRYRSAAQHEADHIVRWQPQRVLREVEAKREFLRDHQPGSELPDHDAEDDGATWRKCTGHEWVAWPCRTVRLLAQPYSDHPDYDESWRP